MGACRYKCTVAPGDSGVVRRDTGVLRKDTSVHSRKGAARRQTVSLRNGVLATWERERSSEPSKGVRRVVYTRDLKWGGGLRFRGNRRL